jgi:hypothetical protein
MNPVLTELIKTADAGIVGTKKNEGFYVSTVDSFSCGEHKKMDTLIEVADAYLSPKPKEARPKQRGYTFNNNGDVPLNSLFRMLLRVRRCHKRGTMTFQFGIGFKHSSKNTDTKSWLLRNMLVKDYTGTNPSLAERVFLHLRPDIASMQLPMRCQKEIVRFILATMTKEASCEWLRGVEGEPLYTVLTLLFNRI